MNVSNCSAVTPPKAIYTETDLQTSAPEGIYKSSGFHYCIVVKSTPSPAQRAVLYFSPSAISNGLQVRNPTGSSYTYERMEDAILCMEIK